MKLKQLMSATALAGILASYPAIAVAQTAPTTPPVAEDDAKDAIVVTGSRIKRPNLDSNIPVTTYVGEDIFKQGQTNIGDALSDLPQLRSTFVQQNPGAGVGIAGLNLLDLRGLGTARTLVLVNGRRHVAADILANASSPDVNTIPNDLIERVDIVTGGNSAVYGSDAIAGVVNFVLRRDFEGVQLRGNAAVSEAGYGGNQYASVLAGKNFADGRGNITAHVEYAHQERIYASDIPFFQQVDGFATIDADSGGLVQGSDGFPDAVFVRDIRSSANHRYGFVPILQPQGAGAACGAGTQANNGPANTAGTSFNCNYFFDTAGNLIAQTGTRFGSGPTGTFVGGNGQTGREGTLLSILPSNQRINANLLARYEFSPAFEAFLEAKYVRTDTVGNQLGPTFLNNSTASLGNDVRLAPRLDNPFLNATARTTITNAILASGCGSSVGSSITAVTCRPLTATERTNIANGSYRFLFGRTMIDLPDRDEVFRRTTYRIVGGLRGQFNDDWNYEVSINYGKFSERTNFQGFVDRQRFLLSLDAGRNPATGQIQCRSQYDPTAANPAPDTIGTPATAAALQAKLAADIAACVPYNPFGALDNSAAARYFNANVINRSSIDQLDAQGFVSGNTSKFFNLPGGPVRFVFGAEYRREKAFNDSDSAADTGFTNGVYLGDVSAAASVTEGFGELEVPILKDVPFFQELTINGAGRISGYSTAGMAYTYNGGVEWSPVSGVRFRGNYGRAVRAPNVSESSFPAVPNFANGFIDPCNVNAIGGNANRSANCTAQLTAAQLANLSPAGYSLGIISGSNAGLRPEISDSLTVGAVFQPRFLPGFSLSIDYYNIRVKDVIVSLAAQTIVNTCYDTPAATPSPLCGSFARYLGTGTGPQGELPGQILNNSLVSGPQNFARRIRRGVDVEANYRTDLDEDTKLSTRLIYTHGLQSSNFQNPLFANFQDYLLGEVGDPQDEARWDVDVTHKNFTFGYQMRVIGSQLVTTYENIYPNNAGVPGSTGLPLNSDAFDIFEYPQVIYHNLRVSFDVGKFGGNKEKLTFILGVDNVGNQTPPLGTTGTGAGTSIFNIRGRNFYAGFKARF